MKNSTLQRHLRYSVSIAMFAAIAYVCVFVFRFKVSFLTLDVKDSVMAVGALALGPVAGILIASVVALLEFITVSDTGVYGLIMNFLSSASFTFAASILYRFRRRLSSAVIGLAAAVCFTTSVMMLANLFITPFYMGAKQSDVIAMIPTLLLPFNLTKSVLNAAVVLLLYKPLTRALIRARLMPREDKTPTPRQESTVRVRRSLILSAIAVALIVGCVIVLLVSLKGSFKLFA